MSLFKVKEINKFITHFIGNKVKGDGLKYSEEVQETEDIEHLLIKIIEKNFVLDEKFNFSIDNIQKINPIFSIVSEIFDDNNSFVEKSQLIARYLYEKSDHPKIKSGELCIGLTDNLFYDSERYNALFFLKSEEKSDFLKVILGDGNILIQSESGISLDKVDKGCLILNKDKNYFVFLTSSLVDKSVKYWNEDFLKLKPVNNDYFVTRSYLESAKKVILNNSFDDNFERISCISKTIDFFENNNEFREDLFREHLNSDEIFIKIKELNNAGNDEEVVDFKISSLAVNKNKKAMKRIIKLDHNFKIYISGGGDKIEKSVDDKGRKFYKFYYDDEV